MIKLKALNQSDIDLLPEYQTSLSAGADLKSAEDKIISAGEQTIVRTGVKIDSVDWSQVPDNMLPELQIRARSGLALKSGITLTNAIGTVDADFDNEICVLLWNTSNNDFVVKRGDRIAQVTLSVVYRIAGLIKGGKRAGGFGSTGVESYVDGKDF